MSVSDAKKIKDNLKIKMDNFHINIRPRKEATKAQKQYISTTLVMTLDMYDKIMDLYEKTQGKGFNLGSILDSQSFFSPKKSRSW